MARPQWPTAARGFHEPMGASWVSDFSAGSEDFPSLGRRYRLWQRNFRTGGWNLVLFPRQEPFDFFSTTDTEFFSCGSGGVPLPLGTFALFLQLRNAL